MAALVVHGELRRDEAGLLEREDPGQVFVRVQGAMRVVRDTWRHGETAIVVGQEDREEGRGLGRARDSAEAELLDEPILQRAVGPLDAALRLRAVRAKAVDVEVPQRAPELREPGAALGFDTGGTDGRVGNDTMRAVRDFQRQVGMRADGCAGATLLARLRRAGR